MASPAFVVQTRARDDGGPVRVGFTVTKKVGTATERNRVRRRLRELVKRLDVISMRPHHDYVIVGRRAALDAALKPCSTICARRSAASSARRRNSPATLSQTQPLPAHARVNDET